MNRVGQGGAGNRRVCGGTASSSTWTQETTAPRPCEPTQKIHSHPCGTTASCCPRLTKSRPGPHLRVHRKMPPQKTVDSSQHVHSVAELLPPPLQSLPEVPGHPIPLRHQHLLFGRGQKAKEVIPRLHCSHGVCSSGRSIPRCSSRTGNKPCRGQVHPPYLRRMTGANQDAERKNSDFLGHPRGFRSGGIKSRVAVSKIPGRKRYESTKATLCSPNLADPKYRPGA